MKISKIKLKALIENYLKEESGDSFLEDNPDDLGVNTDFLDRKDYSKEYKEKSKLIVNSVDVIYEEAIQKYENANNPLSDKEKKLTRSYLDNIRLVLIKAPADEPTMIAAAYGLSHMMKKDKKGGRIRSKSGYPAVEKITDDMVLAGKENLKAHMSNKLKNPIIAVIADDQRTSTKVTKKDIKEVIMHELDHIKYGIFYMKNKKFNVKEIENLLRKDLIGKSMGDAIKIFEKENFFKGVDDLQKTGLIKVMFEHYQNIFGDKEEIQSANYEEFSVRINLLTRKSNASDIVEKINKQEVNLKTDKGKYGEQLLQLIPFLKKPVSLSDMKKVVKAKIKKSDSKTA